MHAEQDRPLHNPYACCDRLIESGRRNPELCYPVCPWERALHTPYLLDLWEIWRMSTVAHTITEQHGQRTVYETDIPRLRFAMVDVFDVDARARKWVWQVMDELTAMANGQTEDDDEDAQGEMGEWQNGSPSS